MDVLSLHTIESLMAPNVSVVAVAVEDGEIKPILYKLATPRNTTSQVGQIVGSLRNLVDGLENSARELIKDTFTDEVEEQLAAFDDGLAYAKVHKIVSTDTFDERRGSQEL